MEKGSLNVTASSESGIKSTRSPIRYSPSIPTDYILSVDVSTVCKKDAFIM